MVPPPRRRSPTFQFENEAIAISYRVIQKFKKRITSDPLGVTNTWRGPNVCSTYKGFYCEAPPGLKQRRVASIDFNGFRFANKAQLPLAGFLDKFPDLAIFHANSNNFTDTIPSISHLRYLYELDLSNNQLSGCLPYEIGLLRKATVLDFGGNLITGPIPISFGCLGKIEQLNLAKNMMFGEVPEVVCELPRLLNLSLSFNYFTQAGPICRGLAKRGVIDLKMNCIRDLPGQRSPSDCAMFFKKPKFCPDPASLKISPCNKVRASGASSSSSSSSYSALTEHRHHRDHL